MLPERERALPVDGGRCIPRIDGRQRIDDDMRRGEDGAIESRRLSLWLIGCAFSV